jgi:Zn-dependent peptidase ImmA (M78 family)
MKLPRNVTIGGIKFKVVIAALDDGDFGRMCFDERKIVISDECADFKTQLETLRHEMLHAALHVSGVSFSQRYDEENIVRAIEHLFFPAFHKVTFNLK